MINPVISNVSPKQDEKITIPDPVISAELTDIGTGINQEKTRMWVDGNEMLGGLSHNQIADGYRVNYVPNVLTQLKPGLHTVKIRTEDYFGNFTTKEWTFYVVVENASLSGVVPNEDVLFNGKEVLYINEEYEYKIIADKYTDFSKLSLSLKYNDKAIEIIEVKLLSGLEVIENTIDDDIINIIMQGMNNLSYDTDVPLICISFRVISITNGNVSFTISSAEITDNRVEGTIDALFDGFSKQATFAPYVVTSILIQGIGTITLDSYDKIVEARTSYDTLTKNHQAKVSNYQTLLKAESDYEELVDAKKAKEVDDLIEALGTITIDKKTDVENARTKYNNLNETQKAFVTKLNTLIEAENKISELEKKNEKGCKKSPVELAIALILLLPAFLIIRFKKK
jgi:hypothetical protein